MGATIEISAALLDQARALADREHTTVRALIEEALRYELGRRAAPARPFVLEDGSVGGDGLHPSVRPGDANQMLALMYDDHVE